MTGKVRSSVLCQGHTTMVQLPSQTQTFIPSYSPTTPQVVHKPLCHSKHALIIVTATAPNRNFFPRGSTCQRPRLDLICAQVNKQAHTSHCHKLHEMPGDCCRDYIITSTVIVANLQRIMSLEMISFIRPTNLCNS